MMVRAIITKMKFIFLIAFNFAIGNCFSQSTNPADSLDMFTGTWFAKNDSVSLELKLIKTLHLYKASGNSEQVVLGWHKCIKNNTIISSSYNATDFNITDSNYSIFGFYIYKQKLFFSFIDSLKHKRGKGTLEFLDGSTDKIKFILFNPEPVYFNLPGQTPYDLSFSIPTEFILCRIKE
jgi:hypothetical protein